MGTFSHWPCFPMADIGLVWASSEFLNYKCLVGRNIFRLCLHRCHFLSVDNKNKYISMNLFFYCLKITISLCIWAYGELSRGSTFYGEQQWLSLSGSTQPRGSSPFTCLSDYQPVWWCWRHVLHLLGGAPHGLAACFSAPCGEASRRSTRDKQVFAFPSLTSMEGCPKSILNKLSKLHET